MQGILGSIRDACGSSLSVSCIRVAHVRRGRAFASLGVQGLG